jgi:hypothetical protein
MKTGGRATEWPMRLAGLLVLAVSAPAAAAPCSVTISRAPEGVREVVDHWVGAEPHCTAALEVRIVETAGGLYVIARDDRGRLRDRVVPDAQTAGVLIASWAADDTVALWTPPGSAVSVTTPATAPIVAAARPLTSDELVQEGRVERPVIARSPGSSERPWIRLGYDYGLANAGIGGPEAGHQVARGLRGSVGVWNRGPWTVDVSLDFVDVNPTLYYPVAHDPEEGIEEFHAFANLGYVLRSGRWSFTPSIGAGAGYATLAEDVILDMSPPGLVPIHDHALMWVAQATALGAVDLTPRLQLTMQVSSLVHQDSWAAEQNFELMWIGGVGVAM